MEHYHYPSPQQRLIAGKIAAAGADILLGHHPHVLQGEERIGKTVISYSSGNFLFDEFPWSASFEDGSKRDFHSALSEKNRQGMMLKICFMGNSEIVTKHIFTKITGDAIIELDTKPARQKEYKRFSSRLHMPLYDIFWKMYSIKREWDLRLKYQLSPGYIIRKFYKIRPKHFKEIYTKLRRSSKISSGKSTNPYEN
jgi:hypothetical protein